MFVNKELKRKIIFTIFTCTVLIVLASFLVVKIFAKPQNSNDVYATEFNLDCPRDINVSLNTEIKFKKIYSVSPSNYNKGIEFEITPKSYLNYCSFDFENNTFKASKVGSYYIKFKVKFSDKYIKTQTIKLTVNAENEFLDIKQTKNQIEVGQTFQINDVFEVNNLYSYSISVEDNSILNFNNNIFTANKVGSTNVYVTIDRDYLSYNLVFPFKITQKLLPDDEKTNPDKTDSETGDNTPSNPNEEEKPPENPGKDNENVEQNPPEHNDGNPSKDNEDDDNQDVGGNENDNKDINDNKNDDEKDEPTDNQGGDEKIDDGQTDDSNKDNNDKDESKDEEVKPTYKIIFKQGDLVLGENDIHLTLGNNCIEFCLYENDVETDNQRFRIEIVENDGCVDNDVQVFAPLFYINAIKEGKFKLKVTSILDPSITFIVEFAVINI